MKRIEFGTIEYNRLKNAVENTDDGIIFVTSSASGADYFTIELKNKPKSNDKKYNVVAAWMKDIQKMSEAIHKDKDDEERCGELSYEIYGYCESILKSLNGD